MRFTSLYVSLTALAVMFVIVFIQRELAFTVAFSLLRNGDYDKALARLARMEKLGLKSTTLRFLKGTILMFAGRYHESEQALRQCLDAKTSPLRRSLALVNLGYVLLEERQY